MLVVRYKIVFALLYRDFIDLDRKVSRALELLGYGLERHNLPSSLAKYELANDLIVSKREPLVKTKAEANTLGAGVFRCTSIESQQMPLCWIQSPYRP